MNKDVVKSFSGSNVTLVAVSKTRSAEEILVLYNLGQRDFGENRVQELMAKKDVLPGDIRWHMIGHLQNNKVKYIAPFIHLIHSVDSLDLYQTIYKEAQKAGRTIDVLLQFHIAEEETKFGMDYKEAEETISAYLENKEKAVRITGIMAMATLTGDESRIRKEFGTLKQYFDQLKEKYFKDKTSFREISMGMSSDYKIAVEEGSTMVRIGSLLFQ